MKSLSWLAGGLGDAVRPSVGHVQFELLLPLSTAAGAAGSGGGGLGERWGRMGEIGARR